MNSVAIIQARMGATRLPGKVLMRLGDRPVLAHVVTRARMANVFRKIIVATTDRAEDDVVETLADSLSVDVFRGSENDVLQRYALAARAFSAESVTRITSDCPLIDPDVLAKMLHRFEAMNKSGASVALVTNARLRTFPRGLDAEVMSASSLYVAHREAHLAYQREHVTPFFYEHSERFCIVDYTSETNYAHHRWTLDTPEDYDLLTRVFGSTTDPDRLRLADIVKLMNIHPDWMALNAHIKQKEVGGSASDV